MKASPLSNSLVNNFTGWKFKLYLISKLPMGLLAGMRVKSVSNDAVITSVPYNYLTKNPFKSMYFAVQSMAAELSTAIPCLLAIQNRDPSVAFIIVKNSAVFHKKATSKVFFTCEEVPIAFDAVNHCIDKNRPVEATFKTVGRMSDGTIVSSFEFTWSFKQRA